MCNKEFKASHFNNIQELIDTCKMWIKDDDYDVYCRFFDMGAMQELIEELERRKENKQVEIIEEDKSIEELKEIQENDYMLRYPNNEELMNKINELVKEVNKLKENK